MLDRRIYAEQPKHDKNKKKKKNKRIYKHIESE